MKKIRGAFYQQADVASVAKQLLGKKLCTNINGVYTSGIIVETEAYAGIDDKASHAYKGRRTPRNEVMYHNGGTVYVYLCYGLHHLFNVVTNQKNIPHAVLIRAVVPYEGIEHVLKRRKHQKVAKNTSGGPGTVSQALGISTKLNGIDLSGDAVWIEDVGISFASKQIEVTPRIGIDYAGEDAKLLYRYLVKPEALKTLIKNPTH